MARKRSTMIRVGIIGCGGIARCKHLIELAPVRQMQLVACSDIIGDRARDIAERGRTTDSVIQQYLNTVRPMHQEFVEPSKRYADVIIPEGGLNTVAMDMVVARLRNLLRGDQE